MFPSARAGEPFYATFSFVSRCHARRCVGYAPVRVYGVYARVLDARVVGTRLPPFGRSLVRSSVRSSERRRCAREARRRSVLLFYSRILFFVRADCGRALRLRLAPARPSPPLFLSLSKNRKIERETKKEETVREDRRDSNVPSARQGSSPCRLNPLAPTLLRPAQAPTRRERAPRTFAHLFALIAPDCKETRRRA